MLSQIHKGHSNYITQIIAMVDPGLYQTPSILLLLPSQQELFVQLRLLELRYDHLHWVKKHFILISLAYLARKQ